VAIRVRVAPVAPPLQEIEYRICVHNVSPAAAHHVLVRNPLPANARFVRATPEPSAHAPELQWHLDTLPPGACREIVLVLAPLDASDVKNCARVQFEHGQCVVTRIARAGPPGPPAPPLPLPGEVPPFPRPLPDTVPPMPPPLPDKEPPIATGAKLALAMSGPEKQYANLSAKYQITVTNTGTGPATNVQIANPLPKGTALVAASAGGRFQAGLVAWNLGTLEAKASRTVQITLRATKAGKVSNRATALADAGLSAQAEISTLFEGVSALTLEATDTKDPLPVGGSTTYVIVIKNQGTVAVTNLRLTAIIPPELRLTQARGPSDPPPKDKLPEPAADGQALPFAPLKELAPMGEARYEIIAEARRAGDARFKVELIADQLQAGPVREQESTFIFAPMNGK
jgi:uncharacterized repeat protein (TIGR01451 family)